MFKHQSIDHKMSWDIKLGSHTTNKNIEQLTFPDNSFDIVITSDVMEHVRLDERAHQEIQRVLKPGGIYLFTVPHFGDKSDRQHSNAVGLMDMLLRSNPSHNKAITII